ncbi:MAG: hypothetical protein ACRDKT_12145 [Actinomycetota bacterium]
MTTDMNDRDPFERRLGALMDAASDHLVPAPSLPAGLKRRARVRQAAVALGAFAAVFLVLFVAGSAVRALLPGPDGGSEVAAGERGSSGTYPCTYEPQPHQPKDTFCVATGTFEDAEWTMVTYDSKDGICIDIDVTTPDGGGGGGGCGSGPDRPIGVGVNTGDEYPNGIAFGRTAPNVARLVLELKDGNILDLELYPAPEGADVTGNFYVLFLPDDAEALVAYDDTGAEIARETAFASPAPVEESTPLGPPVPVASGDFEGLPWKLNAYEEQMSDEVMTCTELYFGDDEDFGGGGGCGYEVPSQSAISFSEAGHGDDLPDVVSIFGVIDPRVDDVVLDLPDGEDVSFQIYRSATDRGPGGFDVDFFVGFVETPNNEPLNGTLIARTSDGEVLQRKKLCEDFRAASESTCGS